MSFFLFFALVQVCLVTLVKSVTPIYLNNTQLHCCTLHQFPNVYNDSRSNPFKRSGMALNYLYELQRQLNFQCHTLDEIEQSKIGFTEFIDRMQKCQNEFNQSDSVCQCQMGVGGWMLTQQRYGKVDFLPVFVHDDLRVITHIENTYYSTNGLFFITTYSTDVWFAIAGLMATWTLLKMLDIRFVPPDDSFKPLPSTDGWYLRQRHFLLKSNIPRRLRKSLQSTGIFLLSLFFFFLYFPLISSHHIFPHANLLLSFSFLFFFWNTLMHCFACISK